ncbi:hypothetical protein BS78_05G186600 [Paspalum vaginatum]|nr:hypothetical protein BS78_05G186600 [Paspalum vaginatum]
MKKSQLCYQVSVLARISMNKRLNLKRPLREKVNKSTWLDRIYMLKHKWAECYMLNVFSIGMRSTQLSESLNNALKGHLKSDLDIIRFLKRVELVVQEKRERELQAEFESRKKQPRIRIMTPILIQASTIYTPALFEVFQGEYEKSLAAYVVGSNGTNEFVIAIGGLRGTFTHEEERKVIVNPADQIVECSCRLFERTGILCRHALKGLDLLNIKLLPERYILKRWTQSAKLEIIQDMHGRDIVENPKFDATCRYKNLCQRFLPLASRAADFKDCCLLVEEALHIVSKQVEEKIRGTPNIDASKPAVQEPFRLPEQFANVAGLKKKEKEKGGSKRKKSWVEKFQKKKKKANKKKTSNPLPVKKVEVLCQTQKHMRETERPL